VSYTFRLVCLSLATFFLVQLFVGLAAAWFAPVALRLAERKQPRAAARFLLAVRLSPSVFAIVVVAALCIPSYLQFEPVVADEDIGIACLTAAFLAVAILSISFKRAVRALVDSRRYLRQCEHTGSEQRLGGSPVLIVKGSAVALAGLIRPRVIVAEQVLKTLPPDQLEAALCHERAHAASRDNLKRLLLLLAPDVFPFFRTRDSRVERAWTKFTEWSADDRAVAGDPSRSLSLAAALVRVARMGDSRQPSPLVTSLVAEDLAARVDRLLHTVPRIEKPDRWTPAIVALSAIALATVIFQPAALSIVHRLLERLIN
jgi:beta-lactamase regulating signal transducer with metallopeptidase domain